MGFLNDLTYAEITRPLLEMSLQANKFPRAAEIFLSTGKFSKLHGTLAMYFGLLQLPSCSGEGHSNQRSVLGLRHNCASRTGTFALSLLFLDGSLSIM